MNEDYSGEYLAEQPIPKKVTISFILGVAFFSLFIIYAIVLSTISGFFIGIIIGALIYNALQILFMFYFFKRNNWARITMNVFLVLDILSGISGLILVIAGIAVISTLFGSAPAWIATTNIILFIIAIAVPVTLLILMNARDVVDWLLPPLPPPPPSPTPIEPTIPQRRKIGSFGILIAEEGPLKGQTFKLAPGCNSIIGRGGDITLPQDDRTASREHARIRDENGKFVLYDMGSTNHTYVNGEREERKVLLDNDKVRIGKTVFRFQWMKGNHSKR